MGRKVKQTSPVKVRVARVVGELALKICLFESLNVFLTCFGLDGKDLKG